MLTTRVLNEHKITMNVCLQDSMALFFPTPYRNVSGSPNAKSNQCFEGRQIIFGRSGCSNSAPIGHWNIAFFYIDKWPDSS